MIISLENTRINRLGFLTEKYWVFHVVDTKYFQCYLDEYNVLLCHE
jgi:hypothetical protein